MSLQVLGIPGDELFTVVCGALSAIGSGSVVVTLLIFPSMLRRKLFTSCVFMMSMTDFAASLFVSLGYVRDPVLCSVQGSLTTVFFSASWLWTTMLSFQLYYLVKKGRPKLTLTGMHVLVWSVSLVLFVLPLTTQVTYGLRPEDRGWALCGFVAAADAAAPAASASSSASSSSSHAPPPVQRDTTDASVWVKVCIYIYICV